MAAVGLSAVVLIAIVVHTGTGWLDRDVPGDLPVTEWSYAEDVEAGLFVSNIPRAAGDGDPKPVRYATHREAAMAEFRRVIRYEEGQFFAETSVRKDTLTGPSGRVVLRFVDESGSTLRDFVVTIPTRASDTKPSSVKAWALMIPPIELRSLELASDTVAIVWKPEMGARGIVTFTYEMNEAYVATAGEAFRF